MSRGFPHFTLRGSHREVGRQHGEALRPLVRAHLDLIHAQGAQNSRLEPETARRWAQAFGSVIGAAAPHFLEEIDGLAQGAGIEPAEALLLQVRQEVAHVARFGTVDLEAPASRSPAPTPGPAGPSRARTPISRAASSSSPPSSPSRSPASPR
jgi:hypothetical protein